MSNPVFFIPGWGLGAGPWQPTVGALGGFILDLPGYGDAPPETDFLAAADRLATNLPAGAVLCGWSLGAMLALAVAARHPGKVAKLVLVAGTASFVQREGWPHAMAPDILAEFTAAIIADPQAMLPRFVGNFNRGEAQPKAVTRELLALASPLPAAEVLANGLAWLAKTDLRSVAPAVTAPTLLIHGGKDPLMPLAAAQALAELLPRPRLEVLENCAHAPFISAPAHFQNRLAAFIHEPAA